MGRAYVTISRRVLGSILRANVTGVYYDHEVDAYRVGIEAEDLPAVQPGCMSSEVELAVVENEDRPGFYRMERGRVTREPGGGHFSVKTARR